MRLMATHPTQVTVVQPLYHQVAEVGLHLAFMQPLILGAARIDVLAAADVHALAIDADLVEVVPVNGKQPPAMAAGVFRGNGNGYGYGEGYGYGKGYGNGYG